MKVLGSSYAAASIWSVNERKVQFSRKRFGITKKTAETGDFATECKALVLAVNQVLLRAGSQGAWFYDVAAGGTTVTIPTLRVKPVVPKLVGDAHSGALCAAATLPGIAWKRA